MSGVDHVRAQLATTFITGTWSPPQFCVDSQLVHTLMGGYNESDQNELALAKVPLTLNRFNNSTQIDQKCKPRHHDDHSTAVRININPMTGSREGIMTKRKLLRMSNVPLADKITHLTTAVKLENTLALPNFSLEPTSKNEMLKSSVPTKPTRRKPSWIESMKSIQQDRNVLVSASLNMVKVAQINVKHGHLQLIMKSAKTKILLDITIVQDKCGSNSSEKPFENNRL